LTFAPCQLGLLTDSAFGRIMDAAGSTDLVRCDLPTPPLQILP